MTVPHDVPQKTTSPMQTFRNAGPNAQCELLVALPS